jgi:two-component system sensor histidine kinase/response regulator
MPFRVSIFLLLTLLPAISFAQKNEADSLESLVKIVPDDTNKVWLLNKLVFSLRDKDNNRALVFAVQAKDLSELLAYKKGQAQSLENLGWILYRKGDFSKSFEISTQALKISEELQDQQAIARCMINIAAINYEQKLYKAAIENFKKACYVSELIHDNRTVARSLNNISFAFLGMKEIDSAEVYVSKALKLGELVKDVYMVAFSKRTLGDICLLRENTADALKYFNDCLAVSDLHANTFLKVSTLHRLGKTYYMMGQNDKAIKYLTQNIDIAGQFGFKEELERTYKLISEIYFKKKNINQAFIYQSKFVTLHDSLYNQRNSEQIAIMQTRFDSEIKQAQIELLTKNAELKEEEIKSQGVWMYFYIGCLALVLILAFVLLYYNRQNIKAKAALQEKNEQIEKHTHQLRNVNATKDKLFSIISHDLRSPVASLRALMEIVGTTGLTQDEFVDITNKLKQNLDSVYDDLDNLLLWAQTQLKGLQAYPEAITLWEIGEDKIALFKESANNKKIKLLNSIDADAMVYADKNHVNLILRNLIGNAIKFSRQGGTITLLSEVNNGRLEISVIDSGVGINQEDLQKLFNAETHFTRPGTHKEKGAGIGLLLTKEFVETNQGEIWVTSEEGKGSTFTFTLKARQVEFLAQA